MKKTTITTMLIAFFSMAGLFAEEDSDALQRYKVESAIIEFEMSGTQTGTEVLYFDQWGLREATFSNTVMDFMGFKKENNSITVMVRDSIYNVDMITRTGTRMLNPLKENLAEMKNHDDLTDLGMQMMKGMGGKIIGSEEILGKPCEIWEVAEMKTKTWVWNGITLKSETNMAGIKMVKSAKKIKTDVPIPPEKFVLPKDITLDEMPDYQDLIQKYKP